MHLSVENICVGQSLKTFLTRHSVAFTSHVTLGQLQVSTSKICQPNDLPVLFDRRCFYNVHLYTQDVSSLWLTKYSSLSIHFPHVISVYFNLFLVRESKTLLSCTRLSYDVLPDSKSMSTGLFRYFCYLGLSVRCRCK